MSLPALSIKQPWAWLIVNGLKDVENRSWRTDYRGPLLIHAGKAFDDDFDWDWAERIVDPAGCSFPLESEYARGGIVGRAELVDCVTASESPWFFGRYGFVLRNAEPLPFRPCRGALGLFDPDQVPSPGRAKVTPKETPKAAPSQGRLL